MFDTVLVANRGEIAVRVIRTLKRLGIRSVAVYSDADAGAPHVAMADVAVRLGPAPATESYLSIDAVLAAAGRDRCAGDSPGLRVPQRERRVRPCLREGGRRVHRPRRARPRGDGRQDQREAAVGARGVPTVPGHRRRGLDDAALRRRRQASGSRCSSSRRRAAAARACRSSARPTSSPGRSPRPPDRARRLRRRHLLLERLIERRATSRCRCSPTAAAPSIHLGERECSLQRRHQKVDRGGAVAAARRATRARIGEAACEAPAASLPRRGHGRVPRRGCAPDEFFFIEMNTRLQVEHPVTELVTGIDLVEQQLRIAAGEALSFAQDDIRMTGHAIEARIYAESPARDFLPATGTVLALDEPEGDGFRVDSGLVEGLVVGGAYDPMLAKAIAFGADRDEALTRLDALLAQTVVLGLDTNIDELRSVLADPDVRTGKLDTGLLDRRGTPPAAVADADDLAVAAAVLDAARDPGSGPWVRDGWRANGARRPARHGIRTPDGVIDVVVDGVATPGALARVPRPACRIDRDRSRRLEGVHALAAPTRTHA
jgi:acetyl-CoA/propionyl-CoA carboxylase biotin carboxyl carrier protein